MWLYKFKFLINEIEKFTSLVALATFQTLESHLWSLVTTVDSADYRTFLSSQKALSDGTDINDMEMNLGYE